MDKSQEAKELELHEDLHEAAKIYMKSSEESDLEDAFVTGGYYYKNKYSIEVKQDYRQKLFNYMSENHDVKLLESDMAEIENIINPKKYPYS